MGCVNSFALTYIAYVLHEFYRKLNLRRNEREREVDPFWDEIASDSPRRKQRKLLKAGKGFRETDTRSENQRRSGGWGQMEERMSDEEVQFLRRRQV